MSLESPPIDAIASALARELERRGAAGSLSVTQSDVMFLRGSRKRRASLGSLPNDWPQLSAAARSARVRALGLTLAPRAPAWTVWSATAAVLTASIAFGVAIWRTSPRPTIANAGPRLDPGAARDERVARQQRVCEAAASRAMRGATLGPADAEGWVVEMSLVYPAALGPLLTNSGVAPHFRQVDQERAVLTDPVINSTAPAVPDVQLLERELPSAVEQSDIMRYARLTFTAEHAASYFGPETRISWVRLANQLARSTDASHAALYARCEHQSSHHVGAWFYGATSAHTVASLIWSMLGSSRVPLLDEHLLPERFDDPIVLPSLLATVRARAVAQPLDKARLGLSISADGGYLEGQSNGPLAARFPVRDSNRAARAAMRLGRELALVRKR